jgi:hypothetical protein
VARQKRKIMTRIALVGLFALVPATGASAHVHGITPLLRCGGDLSVTGADRTDQTPAGAPNGGPITGLSPRDVGDAPLTGGDGGFDAQAQCVGQT